MKIDLESVKTNLNKESCYGQIYKTMNSTGSINFSATDDYQNFTLKNYIIYHDVLYLESAEGDIYAGNSTVVLDDFNDLLSYFEDGIEGLNLRFRHFKSKKGKQYVKLELI